MNTSVVLQAYVFFLFGVRDKVVETVALVSLYLHLVDFVFKDKPLLLSPVFF